MPFGYPAFLEIAGRRCVVIGAGAVAEGKVEGLLAAGADDVLVLATAPAALLDGLAGVAGVRVDRRRWRPADLDDAFLCVAWAAEPEERGQIAAEARARRVLVNLMDDVPNCDFAAPAIVRRGDLVVAISTGGRSPALARRLREQLQAQFGPEWGAALEVLHRARRRTLGDLPTLAERIERWREALDLEELLELVRAGRADAAEDRLVDRLIPERAELGGRP